MPTDLRNRSKGVQEARNKVVETLTKLTGHRCEITGKFGNTDLHEFWVTSKNVYDDEVALVLLTHPANIIVINHDLHLSQKPKWETCVAAIRHRNNSIWHHFNFLNYYEALIDFKTKIQDFYKTGQIKVPVSYIPKI